MVCQWEGESLTEDGEGGCLIFFFPIRSLVNFLQYLVSCSLYVFMDEIMPSEERAERGREI